MLGQLHDLEEKHDFHCRALAAAEGGSIAGEKHAEALHEKGAADREDDDQLSALRAQVAELKVELHNAEACARTCTLALKARVCTHLHSHPHSRACSRACARAQEALDARTVEAQLAEEILAELQVEEKRTCACARTDVHMMHAHS